MVITVTKNPTSWDQTTFFTLVPWSNVNIVGKWIVIQKNVIFGVHI